MSEFTPTLPADAVDLLQGQDRAEKIAHAMSVSYWMHGRDDHCAMHHLKAVHECFASLAAALGYTIARAPVTYVAVDAAEPAEGV